MRTRTEIAEDILEGLDAMMSAAESGDATAVAEARARLEAARDLFRDAPDRVRFVEGGTEWVAEAAGRGHDFVVVKCPGGAGSAEISRLMRALERAVKGATFEPLVVFLPDDMYVRTWPLPRLSGDDVVGPVTCEVDPRPDDEEPEEFSERCVERLSDFVRDMTRNMSKEGGSVPAPARVDVYFRDAEGD